MSGADRRTAGVEATGTDSAAVDTPVPADVESTTQPGSAVGRLNKKQLAFVLGVVEGKPDYQAYMAAYGVGDKVAMANAPRSLGTARIQAALTELRAKVIDKVIEETSVDKAWVMKRLVQNVERAMQREAVTESDGRVVQYKYAGSVANKALELIGTELGMFKVRIQDIPWDELEPEDLKMIEKGVLPFRLRKLAG